MKLKCIMVLAALAVGYLHVSAQGIVIQLKDGSQVVYPTSEVEQITTVTKDYSYVLGNWYLGFWKYGSTVIPFDGTEYVTFAGKTMTWGGKGGDPATYNVQFLDSGSRFEATNVANSSEVLRWSVTMHTDKLLILRDGDAYRYFYRTQREAEHAQMLQDLPSHDETRNLNTILSYATGYSNSNVTPMGQHFENRHVTTNDDRAWLLNAANEPNKVANLTQWIEKNVTLYPYGNPVPADVNQHAIGDCCACSVLASFAYLYPDFIKHILTDNGNGTYTVKMYDPQGNPVDVCVSNKILCDGNGNIGQVTGKNNAVTWATIMEKALIKWQTLYKVDEGVEGIGTEHVAPLFTGCGDSFAFSPNSLHTSELKLAIEHSLTQGMLCIGGFNVADLQCGKLKTVTGHAFTYMLPDDDSMIFVMRNPWGIEDVDGKLTIPDDRAIVQTIDARIVYPGAAAPYLRNDINSYTPPAFARKITDIGVAPRLLFRQVDSTNIDELW